MTSLPERLRSLALPFNERSARETLHEAADELDRRAEEIQRLGYKLRRIGELAGPPGAWPRTAHMDERAVIAGEPLPPPRPGITLTEDPTKTEEYDATRWYPQETPSEDMEFTFNPGPFTWLVFAHPDGSVSMRRG